MVPTTEPSAAPPDAGFSLIEVIVAMTVLAVMSVAVLGLLVSSLDGSRDNAQRVQAAGIAARQIEAVRGLSAAAIPDGVTTPASSPVTLDGTQFSLRQSAAFLAGDGTTSVCSSSAERPTYKRVTVTVTWPDMGSTAPIRSDTLVAVGLGAAGLDASKGTAAILVRDAQAVPRTGVTVRLLPGSAQQTTDDDGCAVFSGLTPGAYTATVEQPGSVGLDGKQLASTTVGTVAGVVRRSTIDYDTAGSLAVQLVAPSGHSLPVGLAVPVTLEAAHWSPTTRGYLDCAVPGATPGACFTSTPRSASSLFPATYRAWAGTCRSARPATAPAGVPVRAGAPSSTQASLSGVTLRALARSGGNRAPDGTTLFARNIADSGCTATTWNLGTSTSSDSKVALPAGVWTFSAGSGSQSSQVTLVAGVANTTRVDVSIP